MALRISLWTLALSLILGFGWYKSVENERDDQRRAAWQERFNRLQPESSLQWQRMLDRLNEISTKPNARQLLADELNAGVELPVRLVDGRLEAAWVHPEYGFELEFTFEGNRMVSHGGNWGTAQLAAIHPPPPQTSLTSSAEALRKRITRWGGWVWLGVLPFTLLRRPIGLIAAEALLALALACNVAWLVAPNYTLKLRGILSNDSLELGSVLLAVSLLILALRVAPIARERRWSPQLQFSLRALLTAIGVTAILLAMDSFGYVVLAALAIGGLFFWMLLRMFLGTPAPYR